MLTGAIYTRVSSAEQAVEGKSSLNRQRDDCLGKAKTNGHHVPPDLIFRDVISGAKADRPDLNRLLEAAAERRFSILYVWAVDRLGRNTLDALTIVKTLKKYGVSVWGCREGDLSEEFRFNIFALFAEREREQIIERTQPARRLKQSQGYWVIGRPPFGYRLTDERTLEVVPEEAEILKRIFKDARDGLGRTAIATRLNASGINPPEEYQLKGKRLVRTRLAGGSPKLPKGRAGRRAEWQSSSVAKILNNTMAYGERNGCRFIISPAPIISQGEFEDVRRKMKARFRGGKAPSTRWLLSGILRCSCGATYHHHESRNYHRYVCASKRAGKSCENPAVSLDVAEATVMEAAAKFLGGFTAESLKKFFEDSSASQLAKLQEDLKTAEKETKRLVKAQKDAAETFAIARKKISESAAILLLDALTDADLELQKAKSKTANLIGSIHRLLDTYKLSAEEVGKAIEELQRTFRLKTQYYGVSLELEEEETTTDLRSIFHTIIRKAVVKSDRQIEVEFYNVEEDPERFQSMIESLAKKEIEFIKAMRP
ncbi:MAG TPA: recombinase family protein [Alphaproteobacteria bacterium]|nr:recombinase family protein [Alphaproteobacteria bacterium]